MEPVLDCRWARKVMDLDVDPPVSEDLPADNDIQNRPYQDEMIDHALRENIVCALGTGMGKTQVALSVIKSFLHEIEPSWEDGGKRTVMIVPTVPLVDQQVRYIRKWIPTGFQVKGYHGSNCQLTSEFWRKELSENSILVMGHDILKDLLSHNLLDVARINLLVFDECHHATANHSYREIMRFINDRVDVDRPRILGLTASVINCGLKKDSVAEKMEERIVDLEQCFGAKVCTSVDESIKDHEALPSVHLESFKIFPPDKGELEATDGMNANILWLDSAKARMAQLEKVAKKNPSNMAFSAMDERFRYSIIRTLTVVRSSLNQLLRTLRSLGPWCAYQTAQMVKRDLELMLKNNCFHPEMANAIHCAVTQAQMFGSLLEIHYKVHKLNAADIDGVVKASSPKLQKLIDVLHRNKPISLGSNPLHGLRCIVFVEARFDAWTLHRFFEFLTKDSEEFRFLKSGYLVGQQTNVGGGDPLDHRIGLSYKQSCRTLEKFRQGEINLLVATSVIEEGLDVPACNLVIRFDKPPHYCSYLQSKGRARAKGSKFIVLSGELDLPTVREEIAAFSAMDDIMKKTCVTRAVPGADAQQQHFQDKPDDAFRPPGSQATVTLALAIPILQRYCNSLPDQRSSSVIRGQFVDTPGDDYQYRIYMSLSSPIKRPVTGKEMPNRKLAKQSAALECLRILYGLNELDENLFAKVESTMKSDLEEILGEGWECKETVEDGLPLPGTRRRRQYYPKQSAVLLSHCRPVAGQPLFLYHLALTFIRNIQSDPCARFVGDTSCDLGLLSLSSVPPVPAFNIYLHRSEYRVELILVESNVILTQKQMEMVEVFHTAAYEQVARFSDCIALSFGGAVESGALYAVPLRPDSCALSQWQIDWNVIGKVKDPSQYSVRSQPDEARKRMKISADAYRDSVVIRWYKTDDDRFYVLNVCEDFTPATLYPLDEFSSFAEYFERKYGIEVQQLDQPMLETKYCGRQMNLLRPPILTEAKSRSSKLKEQRKSDMKLVPELCQLFPFPAGLYSKCLVLPSVMHRLHWFCQAYSLRNRIHAETGIGMHVNDPTVWSPLLFGPKSPAKWQSSPDDSVGHLPVAAGLPKALPVEMEDPSCPDELPRLSVEPTDDTPDNFGLVYAMFEKDRFSWEASEKRKVSPSSVNDDESPEPVSFADTKKIKLVAAGCATSLEPPPFLLDESFRVDATRVACPDLNQILNALVAARAADGFNLERLEVIGDSFLKLTSCVYMYFRFPQYQEGRLTELCNRQVSNYNMYRLAKRKGLHSYILNQTFEPLETFVPPGFTFDEEESNAILANSGTKAEKFPSPRIHQAIDDKTIADVVEALIGTFLIHSSARSAQLFMSWIGLRVLPTALGQGEGRKLISEQYGIFDAAAIRNPILRTDSDANVALTRLTAGFDDFEAKIGYKFRNKAFLLQAFTHSSYYPNEITDCYQRLEYLGDAVIDFLVTRHVFDNKQNFNPGVISDMRSALVNNRTFATLAVKYDYHKHLKARNPRLCETIEEFVKEVEELDRDTVTCDEDMVCFNLEDEREESGDNEYEEAEAPKALGDIFESVAGAIFLDSELSLDVVWRVYYNIMRGQIEYVMKNCPKNPVRELIELELANCRYGPLETLGNGKCAVQVTVIGKGTYTGRGNNARAAKMNASKIALDRLKSVQHCKPTHR